MSEIRILKDDRSRVVSVTRMSKQFHEEAREGGPFNPSRVSLFLSSVCHSEDAAMFVAVDKFGQASGFLVCQFGANYLTGAKIAEETAIFVLPEYRRDGVGDRLLDEFEDWGRSKGAEWFRTTVQAKLRANGVVRWFESKGYQKAEISMIKEVTT